MRKYINEKKEENKIPSLKANHLNCWSNGFETTNSLNGLNVACCCKSARSWWGLTLSCVTPSLILFLHTSKREILLQITLYIWGLKKLNADKRLTAICQIVVGTNNFNLEINCIIWTNIKITCPSISRTCQKLK